MRGGLVAIAAAVGIGVLAAPAAGRSWRSDPQPMPQGPGACVAPQICPRTTHAISSEQARAERVLEGRVRRLEFGQAIGVAALAPSSAAGLVPAPGCPPGGTCKAVPADVARALMRDERVLEARALRLRWSEGWQVSSCVTGWSCQITVGLPL
jgi:hypothetical protein